MANVRVIIGVLIAIGVLVVMPAGVQAQSDEGLVAEWHFDEGAGSVLKDSSGNGNDGTIYGATWVDGKYGKALSFDGVDDYVEVPLSPELTMTTNSFTVEAWVKTSDAPNKYDGIVGNYRTSTTTFWALSHLGRSYFVIKDANGRQATIETPNPINDGSWHHILGIRDATQGKIQYYVDGVLIGNVPATTESVNSGQSIWIGEHLCRYFDGIIDEVRIYNRALTAEETKSHYKGQQTAVSLTKSTALHSIKQGQTTTITLTVTNTGTTGITDIEVADTIPSGLTYVSGETSKIFASLQPKDSIEFQYILQIDKAGTCNLDPATVTFADEKGNYYIVNSNTATIEVIPTITSTPTPASTLAPTPIPTPIQTSTTIPASTPTQTPASISTPTPSLPLDISPPAISILNPVIIEYNNNGLLEEGEKVKITYGANDPSGVASVKILLDGVMLESRNQAGTYNVITNSLPVGTHTIRVEATDSKSNYNSEELQIIVERTGPSVYFGTTRTTINKGEDAIFTLSAVNPIGNPPMTVQLILKPPSGVSVTSSSFAKAGSGIYTCTQVIESGDNVRSIEVCLTGNQAGTHEIASEVYYMFEGSSNSPTRYDTLTLVVDDHDSTPLTPTPKPSHGFEALVAITGLLAIYMRKRI